MRHVCDAAEGKAWFRIETEAEAAEESQAMRHAVEKFYRNEYSKAAQSFQPASRAFVEQEIGLKAHIQREMAMFLTLRDGEGNRLATAMLPPLGHEVPNFRPIVVGAANSDPYPDHAQAIETLGRHLGIALDRARCYPYRRD